MSSKPVYSWSELVVGGNAMEPLTRPVILSELVIWCDVCSMVHLIIFLI